jgi:hypothetical protein
VCWPLLCLCRPFCILRYVWILTERAAVASRRSTNLATHLPKFYVTCKLYNVFSTGAYSAFSRFAYFLSLYRGRQEGGLIRSKEEEGFLEDDSRASTEETKREKPSHKGISRHRKEKHSPSKCLRVSSISRQNAANCPLHFSF